MELAPPDARARRAIMEGVIASVQELQLQHPLLDVAIVIMTFLIPFAGAAVFLHGWLFRDYELKRRWVQYLFAATFALSVNLLMLALYEILGVIEPAARWLTWRLVLVLLSFDLVVILPFSFVFVLATDSGLHARLARVLGVVAEALFLYLFWRLGDFFPILHGRGDLLSVEGAIGRLGIAGVTTAAILSGYGAVSTPYNYLAVFLQDVNDRDIRAKQVQLRKQVDAIFSKQRGYNAARARLAELRFELEGGPVNASANASLSRVGVSSPAIPAPSSPSNLSSGTDFTGSGSREGAAVDFGSNVLSPPGGSSTSAAPGSRLSASGNWRVLDTGGSATGGGNGQSEDYLTPPPRWAPNPAQSTPDAAAFPAASTAPPPYSSAVPRSGDGRAAGGGRGGGPSSGPIVAVPNGPHTQQYPLDAAPPHAVEAYSVGGGKNSGALPRRGNSAGSESAQSQTSRYAASSAAVGPLRGAGGPPRPRSSVPSYAAPPLYPAQALPSFGGGMPPTAGFVGAPTTVSLDNFLSAAPGSYSAYRDTPGGAAAADFVEPSPPLTQTHPFHPPHPRTSGGDSLIPGFGGSSRPPSGGDSLTSSSRPLPHAGSPSSYSTQLPPDVTGPSSSALPHPFKDTADRLGAGGVSDRRQSGAFSGAGSEGQRQLQPVASGRNPRDRDSFYARSSGAQTIDSSGNSRRSSGFFARAMGAVFGGGSTRDERLAQLEADVATYGRAVETMRDMQEEIFLELSEMTAARARSSASKTLRGRAFNFLGYFLLLYCVYKMAMSLANIVFRRDPTKDPVTLGMEIALRYAGIRDATMWVQPVSLGFVGVLVFASVRGFLVSFSNVFVAWSSSVTSNSVVILLAAVMGVYFISVVLLLRWSMPSQYRQGITRAIGDIQFPFFHRWFDVIFLLSAISSIVLFKIVSVTRQSRTTLSHEERASLAGASGSSEGHQRTTSTGYFGGSAKHRDEDKHASGAAVKGVGRSASSGAVVGDGTAQKTRYGRERDSLGLGRRALGPLGDHGAALSESGADSPTVAVLQRGRRQA